MLLISNTEKGIMQKWDMQELHMPIIHPNHLPLIPVLVCIIQPEMLHLNVTGKILAVKKDGRFELQRLQGFL